jgi:hypothetical protein
MSGKFMKTINPEITAQIEEGISQNQYLNEGIQLVNEAFAIIENIKSGQFNNLLKI